MSSSNVSMPLYTGTSNPIFLLKSLSSRKWPTISLLQSVSRGLSLLLEELLDSSRQCGYLIVPTTRVAHSTEMIFAISFSCTVRVRSGIRKTKNDPYALGCSLLYLPILLSVESVATGGRSIYAICII